MSMSEKLRDSRVLWLIFMIAMMIPLVRPIGIPISISTNTRKVVEAIDNVPEGGLIFLTPDYFMEVRGEMQPMMEAVLKYLLQKDVKIISAGFHSTSAPLLMDEALKTVKPETYGKTYGEDYVLLPFLPGGEATIAAFGADVHALVRSDFYGELISELPLMDQFRTAEDVDLLVSIAAGQEFPEKWIRQWQVMYDIEITGGSVASIYTMLLGYIASGQLTGYLDSSRGAAEFEILTGNPGGSVVSMDAQSIGHIVIIIAIVYSNVKDIKWGSKKE